METEYSIPVDDRMRGDVSAMCNLSQGIREKGRTEGRAEGRAEGREEGRAEGEAGFIVNMYKKGYTLEQIADVAGKGMKEIEAVVRKIAAPGARTPS